MKDRLNDLCAALQDRYDLSHANALRELGEMGEEAKPAVPVILKFLDVYPEYAWEVLLVLAKIGEEQAINVLLSLIYEELTEEVYVPTQQDTFTAMLGVKREPVQLNQEESVEIHEKASSLVGVVGPLVIPSLISMIRNGQCRHGLDRVDQVSELILHYLERDILWHRSSLEQEPYGHGAALRKIQEQVASSIEKLDALLIKGFGEDGLHLEERTKQSLAYLNQVLRGLMENALHKWQEELEEGLFV